MVWPQSGSAGLGWSALRRPKYPRICKNLLMATNKPLDNLIEKARLIGRHKTKKETITVALEEYIKLQKQRSILKAFGTFDFDPSYDYKVERGRL